MLSSVRRIVNPSTLSAGRATFASQAVTFDLPKFLVHGDLGGVELPTTATATKEELLSYLNQMLVVRRMEIACDEEYRARRIRGFCHLYDGQEAVAVGMEAGLNRQDSIITAYRCHGIQYVRGRSVESILAEMYGFDTGVVRGKGGSMHLYSKDTNFWGGAAIVGAQVPVGTGIAFAYKYANKGKFPTNVCVTMYGDGAANQGQNWEAANMAKLWNIPVIYLIENNNYGMGTSSKRSSANTEYYKDGGVAIPGIRSSGMDVLAVREAIRASKQFAGSGKGPLFLEMMTYRYHGHSMSDPGITYRSREEVSQVRKENDCIERLKRRILDASFATEAELKELEASIRAHVDASVEKARQGKQPDLSELYTDIYWKEVPSYIRGAEYATSVFNK